VSTNFSTATAVPTEVDAVAVPVGEDCDVAGAVRSLSSNGSDGIWQQLAAALEQGGARSFLASTGFRGAVGETQSLLVDGRHILVVGTGAGVRSPGRVGDGQPTNDDLRLSGAALARASAQLR